MNIIEKKHEIKVSENIFNKICNELIDEFNSSRGAFDEIKKLDNEYNKVNVSVDKLIKIIEYYRNKDTIDSIETKNYIIIHSGNPYLTLNVLLESLKNSQIVNLVIEDMCVGVNKLIFDIFKGELSHYKIYDMISLNIYSKKEELKDIANMVDMVICIGSRNSIYDNCKKLSNLKFIPFNELFIYCEDESFYDLSRDLFDYCNENGIEAEIIENVDIDKVIKLINKIENVYCSVILTKDEDKKKKFENKIKSQHVFANKNPFQSDEPDVLSFLN